MTTPAALPAAAPRPAEHPLHRVRTGPGWWVSLRGCQAEPVIGGGGKATLAGGSTAVPGVSTGLTARWLPTPLLWPRSLLLQRGPAAFGAAEPIGAREAVNNQPRSILTTSRGGSPAVTGPPRSPLATPGTGVHVPPLHHHRLRPSGTPDSLGLRGQNACPKHGRWQRTRMGSTSPPQLRAGGVWLLGV